MAYHFLAITSSYYKGCRIGWNYSSDKKLDKEVIGSFLQKMKDSCGEVQFGIHKLSTGSTSISSVKEKDKFFEDVIFTNDMDQFISYVANDQKLSAVDLSKYILTLLPVSHVKLQKLLYYTYAEFLKRTNEKLFSEPIVSYRYGPVVESVFSEFTEHGSSIIDYEEDENFIIVADDTAVTPSFIKVVSSEHGSTVIDCVVDTIKKYGKEKPFDLVNKTHSKGGPWDRVYQPMENNVITDDLILRYQHVVQ